MAATEPARGSGAVLAVDRYAAGCALVCGAVDGALVISVELPIRIVSVANLRECWQAKARRTKAHRTAVQWACGWLIRHPMPCRVILTRIAPRDLDSDNLQSAFKATRDGVADMLGVKDNDPRVTWEYTQERGKPKEYAARIAIQEWPTSSEVTDV